MADYEERSMDDLTEEPSPHKLDELRQKGQVAYSRELTSTAVFLVVIGVLYSTGLSFTEAVKSYMKDLFGTKLITASDFSSGLAGSEYFREVLILMAKGLLPIFLAAVVVAIGISIVQTQGLVISGDPIKLDIAKVSPLAGFKRLFSGQNVFQGVKSIFKFCVIVVILYYSSLKDLAILGELSGAETRQILAGVSTMTIRVCFATGMFMASVSGVDYLFQWWSFRKKARMTKQEAKQENKEREGDPQIKARIRSIQRDLARKRMMKSVPKADVIITNPTHFAVAIVYEKNTLAPKVIAKGADFIALKIREIATQHSVPIVENKPLARALYKSVKVGQMVPRSFYQAVAEVLAYVYKLKPKNIFADQDAT